MGSNGMSTDEKVVEAHADEELQSISQEEVGTYK